MEDDLNESENPAVGKLRQNRKAAIVTAAAGIFHAVLLIAAFFLLRANAPKAGAPDADVIAFTDDASEVRMVVVAGLYLIPFAGIAFIWFTVSLRMWVHGSVERLTPLLANIVLVCGIIYVGLLFAAGAALSVLAVTAEYDSSGDPLLLRQFSQYGTTILLVFAMRMAAMIVIAISSIGRSHGVLPKWFAYPGFAVGVILLLTSSLSPVVVFIFPSWLLGICAILLYKARAMAVPPVNEESIGLVAA